MPASTHLGGVVTAQTITETVTAAEVGTADAVLLTMAVPGDATILDVILAVDDLDTGAAGLIDVGDTDDDNRFIAGFSIQAAGNHAAAASGNLLEDTTHTYSATGEQEIEVTVNTAAATGAAGDITLTVIYFRNG